MSRRNWVPPAAADQVGTLIRSDVGCPFTPKRVVPVAAFSIIRPSSWKRNGTLEPSGLQTRDEGSDIGRRIGWTAALPSRAIGSGATPPVQTTVGPGFGVRFRLGPKVRYRSGQRPPKLTTARVGEVVQPLSLPPSLEVGDPSTPTLPVEKGCSCPFDQVVGVFGFPDRRGFPVCSGRQSPYVGCEQT